MDTSYSRSLDEYETSSFLGCKISSTSAPLAIEEDDLREIGDEEPESLIIDSPTASQINHIYRKVFQEWKRVHSQRLAIDEIESAKRDRHNHQHEQTVSTRDRLAKQYSYRVINSPRDYQIEIYERAKAQNTIAVLDTGSGKTLIAVLLLRHILDNELENRANGKHPKVSFFLVEKVALVYQQTAVLETNIDQKVIGFSGKDQVDVLGTKFWRDQFATSMVVVCTADILDQCLMRSFINMEEINLLIFDEAHHAKKNHTYARIMRNFFMDVGDPAKRPKVFGMTASPVDVGPNEDILENCRDLENMLQSRIATSPTLSVIHNPDLEAPHFDPIVYYDALGPTDETALHKQLLFCLGSRTIGSRTKLADWSANARYLVDTLGTWPANAYLCDLFSDINSVAIQAKIDRKYWKLKKKSNPLAQDSDEAREGETNLLTKANELVKRFDLGAPQATLKDLSPKVLALDQILRDKYTKPNKSTRCIVFVERKITARCLNMVFDHMGPESMKSAYLIGSQYYDLDGLSFKQQADTLLKFRNGDLNCLFATSVAEEGLDIQQCNLVIRFDLCKTIIQYIQSRGRARMQGSEFVHLIEKRNWSQMNTMSFVKHGVLRMKKFCEELSWDRKLLLREQDMHTNILERNTTCRCFKIPETGAVLSYDNSLLILQHFVDTLPPGDEDDCESQLHYSFLSVDSGFSCEVVMPPNSPVQRSVGQTLARKSLAKRSAAFEACLSLIKQQYLDKNLLSIYKKVIPELRCKALAITSNSLSEYPMKLKPDFWDIGFGCNPVYLYMMVIQLESAWERPVAPIGLLTRARMPQLPEFPIFKSNGDECQVKLISLKDPIGLDSDHYQYECDDLGSLGTSTESQATRIEILTGFTLRIYQDVFNKTFEFDTKQMSYWLAPLIPANASLIVDLDAKGDGLVDWKVAAATHFRNPVSWTSEISKEYFVDRFIVDPGTGRRRFFTKGVTSKYKATDRTNEADAHLSMKNVPMQTIIDFSTSSWKRTGTEKHWNPDQPVYLAEQTSYRLNVLARLSGNDRLSDRPCYICLEPLIASQIPSCVAAMALLFPAIIHRIESYLIALEFVEVLQLEIQPALALEALTKDFEDELDSQSEQITSHRGMGPNYERLEFIGDCFLKMAVSIALYSKMALRNEEEMHLHRMISICNKNLFNVSKKNQFFRNICATSFSRRLWYPTTLKLLKGKAVGIKNKDTSVMQKLSDKTIADVSEAVIGASLMSHFDPSSNDQRQFDNAVRAVTLFVDHDSHRDICCWADYAKAYTVPQYFRQNPRAYERQRTESMAEKLGYRFKNPRILACAFNDPSNPMQESGLPSYQRLEFLGDALHDLACVTYLVHIYPNRDPQWLTEHKMAMVSNQFLGALSVKLKLHTHLRHRNSSMRGSIEAYVSAIRQAEASSPTSKTYWMNVNDPPKCLPDLVESYVGAVFIDSNFNYAEVQRFFDKFVKQYFEQEAVFDQYISNQPITRLFKRLNDFGCVMIRLMSDEIEFNDVKAKRFVAALIVHGKTVAHGIGKNAKSARAKAANNAMEKLVDLSLQLYRQEYRCDCEENRSEKRADGLIDSLDQTL